MTSELFLSDLQNLAESVDVECKAAQGRNGRGEIPSSAWESYSAMANTSGGDIYLGVEETEEHRFVCKGIVDIDRIHKAIWDTLHSRNKVNKNILAESDVQILSIDGLKILHIHVPRARRQDMPVHLGSNPFGNTFLRRYEGDYRADNEAVKRMLAEAIEDSRDDRILEHFGIDDLDRDTVNAYRNRFSSLKPDHPWLELSVEDFLDRIGAQGKDRQTGKSGLRLAGLLMFGRYETIKEELPYYLVDYQERPAPKTEARWIDRILPDGTWSGNLYDFYQKVIRKLTSDLKVPFQLQEETRIDDTPIHQALREALTNALIHADYSGRVSVLVVKRPDLFGFRNPGLMRVSVDQAMTGGVSDCRNRRIQDLFRYIGLGEHAGSGVPGILRSWKTQHWRTPLLYEDRTHDQSVLELRTSSLLPEESVRALELKFGERFHRLSEIQRIALITADSEGFVSHSRMRGLSTEHPKDLSTTLTTLVKEGFLEKEGETRATIYFIKGTKPRQFFTQDSPDLTSSSPDLNPSSPDLTSSSPDLNPSSPDLTSSSPDLNPNSPDLTSSSPDLNPNSPDLEQIMHQTLHNWGLAGMPGKLPTERMRELIIQLCKKRWLTLVELSAILKRDTKALQDQYLTKMVSEGWLELRYPGTKNHPQQAYGTTSDH